MIKSLAIVFCLTTWIACSKKSDSERDRELPTVNITSPANNTILPGAQLVDIAGTIADNVKVAEMHVHIYNNTTGSLLVDIHRYPNTQHYLIDETFQAQAGNVYKIQIIASDNSGNQGTQTIFLTCN